MIKISKGPTIEKFALCFISGLDYDQDEAINEVINWISGYVNGPWSETQLTFIEDNEKDRLKSIKQYMEFRLKHSVTQKVKEYAHN
jgi:hypothetical protein